MKRFLWGLACVLVAAALGMGVFTLSAHAASVITVNSTDGTWNPGDGKCTLREAINNANNDSNALPNSSPDCAAGNGTDTIELGASQTYTFTEQDNTVGAALPVITSDMTINGHGSTLERSAADDTPYFNFLYIQADKTMQLNDIIMENGFAVPTSGGGAIINLGTLTVQNGGFYGNTTGYLLGADDYIYSPGSGGAIYTGQKSMLTINNVIFSANRANNGYDGGNGIYADGGDGGAIYNFEGTVNISKSSFSSNHAGDLHGCDAVDETCNYGKGGSGGAILNAGTMTIAASTFSDNRSGTGVTPGTPYGSGGTGGAITNSGTLTVADSSFVANTLADGYTDGAAIFNGPSFYSYGGTLTVSRSFFYRNNAGATSNGGAISIWGDKSQMAIYNSTFTENSARQGGAIFATQTNSVTLVNNTIASNYTLADDAAQLQVYNAYATSLNDILDGYKNCLTVGTGTIVNYGNNLDSGSSCGWGSNVGSQSFADPKLSAPADNGGPTWTMALAADSAALDHGSNGTCVNPPISNLDQRSFTRIAGLNTTCDVGAFEYAGTGPTATPTLTNPPTNTPTKTNTPITPIVTNTPTATQTFTPTSGPTPTLTPGATATPACATAPAAPTLLSPAKGASVTKRRVQLDWSDVDCTVSHSVVVRQNSKTGTQVDSATGLTTSGYKTIRLTRGATYFWRASACNGFGCTNSKWRKFSITP